MKNGQSFRWKLLLLLFHAFFLAASTLAAQRSLLDDELLIDANKNRQERRYRTDSLVRIIELQLEDSTLDPNSRRALVLNLTLVYSLSDQGQYTRSAGILLRVLPVLERTQDVKAQGFANVWLSYDYNMLEQYPISDSYARRALALFIQTDDLRGQSDALNSIGNCFHKLDVSDSALFYYQKSARAATQDDYVYGIARAHNNIANVLLVLKQFTLALENYRKAVTLMRQISNDPPAFFINNIGLAYLHMEKYDSALFYNQMALDSAGSQPDHSLLMNIYGNLARAYAGLGDYQRAYGMKDSLMDLNQIALNERSLAQLAEREALYQSEAKLQRIALLEADNSLKELEIARNVDRRNILLGAVVTLLIIGALGWLAYRNKRQSNKLLSEQKNRIELMNSLLEDRVRERTEALSRVNAELDQLLYRSSHDLRTPVTKLKGLIGLLEVEKEHAESLKLMNLVSLSVSHLDKLNLSICEAGNIRIHTPKIVGITLSELVGEIQEKMNAPQLKCVFFPPTGCVVHADRWLLALALQELLQNAVDALDGKEAIVTFTCPQQKSGYEILVSDNGPGIPSILRDRLFELFSKGNNHPGRHGLGLYKARLAIEKMEGRLVLKSAEASGTVFQIVLHAPVFS